MTLKPQNSDFFGRLAQTNFNLLQTMFQLNIQKALTSDDNQNNEDEVVF